MMSNKVLVVDDSGTMRKIIIRALNAVGFPVQITDDHDSVRLGHRAGMRRSGTGRSATLAVSDRWSRRSLTCSALRGGSLVTRTFPRSQAPPGNALSSRLCLAAIVPRHRGDATPKEAEPRMQCVTRQEPRNENFSFVPGAARPGQRCRSGFLPGQQRVG